ncbi:hypothetical protein [Bacillus toyonensis]
MNKAIKKKQLSPIMNNRAKELLNALTKFHTTLIEELPMDIGISVIDLVEHFNDEERAEIENTWGLVWIY